MRMMIRDEDGATLAVEDMYVTVNLWEYFLEPKKPMDSFDSRFGLVVGDYTEFGYSSLAEITPYIISHATGEALNNCFPAPGWHWKE